MNALKALLNKLRSPEPPAKPDKFAGYPDFGPELRQIIERVQPYSMSGPDRMAAMYEAARYVAQTRMPGAVVECGVWKGGSMMLGALGLLSAGERDRPLYLFDTFEGMTAPTDADRSPLFTPTAAELLSGSDKTARIWAVGPLDEVRANMASTGYPPENVKFIKGPVEETIPVHAPEQIALLRLDTDWYESTRHELVHLYPRLVPGGILIIDDYGHWAGARKAVDEYIAEHNLRLFLNRIDYTGRLAVKPS
jgi:O-methyltransferase